MGYKSDPSNPVPQGSGINVSGTSFASDLINTPNGEDLGKRSTRHSKKRNEGDDGRDEGGKDDDFEYGSTTKRISKP